jgi:hypothetical protein
MKPLVKVQIPFSETVAMADSLLAQPPEWFEPFMGHVPTFDEITEFVDAQVKERMDDEVWANDIYQGSTAGEIGKVTKLLTFQGQPHRSGIANSRDGFRESSRQKSSIGIGRLFILIASPAKRTLSASHQNQGTPA